MAGEGIDSLLGVQTLVNEWLLCFLKLICIAVWDYCQIGDLHCKRKEGQGENEGKLG